MLHTIVRNASAHEATAIIRAVSNQVMSPIIQCGWFLIFRQTKPWPLSSTHSLHNPFVTATNDFESLVIVNATHWLPTDEASMQQNVVTLKISIQIFKNVDTSISLTNTQYSNAKIIHSDNSFSSST